MKKYLKCSSCGAEAEIIRECTCGDCGVKCCGKAMEVVEHEDKSSDGKVLTCPSCGAQVRVIHDCTCENCGFSCCGKAMA